jgi:MOSC domain-containing protein YiiM
VPGKSGKRRSASLHGFSCRPGSLTGREQIADHAAALGLQVIPPGVVRANIETIGVNLVACVGRRIQIGEAILLVYEPRKPCEKMDAICSGLRELMKNNRQRVLAEVIRSGTIRVRDSISVHSPPQT